MFTTEEVDRALKRFPFARGDWPKYVIAAEDDPSIFPDGNGNPAVNAIGYIHGVPMTTSHLVSKDFTDNPYRSNNLQLLTTKIFGIGRISKRDVAVVKPVKYG